MSALLPHQTSNAQSTAEKFYRYYQGELTALQEQVSRLEHQSPSGAERTDAIEHCSAGIARLTTEVRDVSDSLPAHDRQSYTDSLKALSTKFQSVRSQLSRKQKFSFKNSAFKVHKNESAISLQDAAELAQQRRNTTATGTFDDASNTSSFVTTPLDPHTPERSPNRKQTPASEQDKQTNIADVSDKVIAPVTSPVIMTSISRVSKSIIDLSRAKAVGLPLQTLSLKDISSAIIICPKVSGPIHLTNISRSIIVADCRQFRMHDSSGCDIYLHCTSRPIIEDCCSIRFAPLTGLSGLEDDIQGTNMWSSVDDFKWLRGEPSPNWSVLHEDGQLTADVWAKITSVEDGSDPSAVLQQTRLQD